jgi:peptide deformylase
VSISETLSLIHHPNPILGLKAKVVDGFDGTNVVDNPEIQDVVQKMIKIMKKEGGVGLSAPQVGLSWRLFVTINPLDLNGGVVWINPTIETLRDKGFKSDFEGCLSLPGIQQRVRRANVVRIKGCDENGKYREIVSNSPILARIWQHEYDHLDGVLIIDKGKKTVKSRGKKRKNNRR